MSISLPFFFFFVVLLIYLILMNIVKLIKFRPHFIFRRKFSQLPNSETEHRKEYLFLAESVNVPSKYFVYYRKLQKSE